MELKDIFNKESINRRAKEEWDYKSSNGRIRCGHKYNHIFDKTKVRLSDWNEIFENLTKQQQNVIIKGELIRTYDALSNKDKSIIKSTFGLSAFSSKWFKLPSEDKKKLLKFVI